MNRTQLLDISILIILYLGVVTLPFEYWVNNNYAYYGYMIIVLLVYLIFLYIYMRMHEYLYVNKKRTNYQIILFLLPLILVCFSNFIYGFMFESPSGAAFSYIAILEISFLLLSVFIEEMLFRYLLLGHMKDMHPLKAIIISSLLFSIFHLSKYLSSFDPHDLIIVIYTFGLGMVLGFIYWYSHSILASIIFHILFNLINDYLFTNIYYVHHELAYYLVNIIVGITAAIYLVVIYLIKLRKFNNLD